MIQVYFGNGKGKTTCAAGLSVRALGRDKKVLFLQFLKCENTGEHICFLKNPAGITFKCSGNKRFLFNLNEKEKQEFFARERELFSFAAVQIKEGGYDLIVLDEVLGAIENKILSVNEVISLLDIYKNKNSEIILTGRVLPNEIFACADLVTQMKEEKHYFNNGQTAREGIEY